MNFLIRRRQYFKAAFSGEKRIVVGRPRGRFYSRAGHGRRQSGINGPHNRAGRLASPAGRAIILALGGKLATL